MIRLLQLSDIHFHNNAPEDNDYAQMQRMLPEDIERMYQRCGTINHILICGDIAFSGQPNQYEEADMFIQEVKNKANCDNVFVVPGNHDLDRTKYEQLKEAVRQYALDNESFLSVCRSKEPLVVKSLYSQFEAYYTFASRYNSIPDVARKMIPEWRLNKRLNKSFPNMSFESSDKFYWKSEIGSEGGYTVNLFGVNTAIWASKNDYISPNEYRKQILPKQMWNVTRNYNKEINVLMAHHPFDCLENGDKLMTKLIPFFNVQVFGHVHKQNVINNGACIIQSGALEPDEQMEEYFPVYNIIEMEVLGQNLQVRVISRKWDGIQFEDYVSQQQPDIIPLIPVVPANRPKPVQTILRPRRIQISETQLRILFFNHVSDENAKRIITIFYPTNYRLNLLLSSNKKEDIYLAKIYFFGQVKKDERLEEFATKLREYLSD